MKNEEMKEKVNADFGCLSKDFKALTVEYQKGVLKMAQGLLKIQRIYKTMVADNAQYAGFSIEGKE